VVFWRGVGTPFESMGGFVTGGVEVG